MDKTRLIAAGIALVLLLSFMILRRKSQPEYAQGEIYSVQSGKGYQIVKILAVDSSAIHLRLYKNAFPERPVHVDLNTLTLGRIDDPDGFGVGHLPLSRSALFAWHPVLVSRTTVTQEELEGYEEWKKSGGGIWGPQN